MALSKKDKIQLGIIVMMVGLIIFKLPDFVRFVSGTTQKASSGVPNALPALPENAPDFLKAMVMQVRSGTAHPHFNLTQERALREQQALLKEQSWGRDPFFSIPIDESRSKKIEVTDSSELVLKAISLKGTTAMAIINQTVIHVGDEILGMTVKSIERGRVILANSERERVLRFGGMT
ncbi:MAG: hypothetical protein COV74_02775 [Candidatus Omnitrophica bacterium CG11_big_fil_rev_8_21_14_0_20_45_26]|uniref:Uncharacterized protein n=1 Tax=Candidatus Abzuiibacterium crystallinum TaxID=1974748 RepID=A0A2H0LRH6_9BACT|nr:MAG: hypothetical protein COV74_02775 [Candidatus Omnitrophica bacterium CG11_big_fil_rev_8_21_14_0_20_45_26]PIW65554.1 MAG: hypothetical protein COW12_01145 [Candidatus Omnitrophica bacterium CG12_big_fil_rev_8_21_14_0_65_45_16]